MIPELDLAQIKRFVSVVEFGGFAAAARHLNMSQQALSASIARLEASTGVRFLERKRGSAVELTSFGRLLLERSHAQLALSDRLMEEISHLRDAAGGCVNIGIGETMSSDSVARAISRFNLQNPDVQIRIIEDYTERLISRLIDGELDFVLGSASYALADSESIQLLILFDVEDMLVVRAAHPLARAEQVGLADLARYPWIIPGARNDDFSDVQRAYAHAGIAPPRTILRSDAFALGIWLILETDYVVCASPDRAGVLIRHGIVKEVRCPGLGKVRQASIVTSRERRLEPAAERLKDEILFEMRAAGSAHLA